MFLRALALALDKGEPPAAAKVQYCVECWRELRRRKREAKAVERFVFPENERGETSANAVAVKLGWRAPMVQHAATVPGCAGREEDRPTPAMVSSPV
jgi:hypothetical protein